MRIMSFNVLCYGSGKHDWTKRIPLVVRTIRNCNPDTFGVQEAHYDWMKALIAAFPDYDYVGVGRDNGKKRGEFSAVFYKKDELGRGLHKNLLMGKAQKKKRRKRVCPPQHPSRPHR